MKSICLALILIFSTCTATAQSNVLAHWTFDEPSGGTVFDISGNGNDGTISEATRIPGRNGGAIRFDGMTGHVFIPHQNQHNTSTNEITLEAVIKPTGSQATGLFIPIVAKNRPGSRRGYSMFITSDNRILAFFGDGNSRSITSTTSLPLNEWTHIAATYQGTISKFYINGTLDAERDNIDDIIPSPSEILIGGGNDPRRGTLNGAIDEIRITQQALEPEEFLNFLPLAIVVSQELKKEEIRAELLEALRLEAITWIGAGGFCLLAPPACVKILFIRKAVSSLSNAVTATKLIAISNDPPSPEFQTIFLPQEYSPPSLSLSPDLPVNITLLANRSFQDFTELYAITEAWLITLERYRGAIAATEQEAAELQLTALAAYIRQASNQSASARASLAKLTGAIEPFWEIGETRVDEVAAHLADLQDNGFGLTELAILADLGLTQEDVEVMREAFLSFESHELTGNSINALRGLTAFYDSVSNIGSSIIVENTRPTANPGADQFALADSICQATVILDGTSSNDPDDDELTFLWKTPAIGAIREPTATVSFPEGTHLVSLTVDDGRGLTDTALKLVEISDKIPPEIHSIEAHPPTLWPPNHRMVEVEIRVEVSDNCTALSACRILSVMSSELSEGLGSQDRHPDIEITGPLTVRLRAERFGSGNGREYTLRTICSDQAGNRTTGTVKVEVPHDRGK